MKYTKDLNEPLIFIECLKMLEVAVDNGILQRDPDEKNNILVYRAAGDDYHPEGWYSENIHSVAQELLEQVEDQIAIREALQERGIILEFPDVIPAKNGEKRNYIDD
ncbi:MAG: hypothetical protein J5992_00435 [Oscillospiraceae bacterium]|nr:hypothetical protein [Oscillospiraceae bacterium]